MRKKGFSNCHNTKYHSHITGGVSKGCFKLEAKGREQNFQPITVAKV